GFGRLASGGAGGVARSRRRESALGGGAAGLLGPGPAHRLRPGLWPSLGRAGRVVGFAHGPVGGGRGAAAALPAPKPAGCPPRRPAPGS
nr:hypothetical protein [Tanacetum cinerariifolium]